MADSFRVIGSVTEHLPVTGTTVTHRIIARQNPPYPDSFTLQTHSDARNEWMDVSLENMSPARLFNMLTRFLLAESHVSGQ